MSVSYRTRRKGRKKSVYRVRNPPITDPRLSIREDSARLSLRALVERHKKSASPYYANKHLNRRSYLTGNNSVKKDSGSSSHSKIVLALLKAGLIYGTVAAVPASAPIILPAYYCYNYASIGSQFYNLYRDIMNKRSNKQVRDSLSQIIGSGASETSEKFSSSVSKEIVDEAKKRGIINQIAIPTNVEPGVYTRMMEGSIANGLSEGIGGLASFAIQNI